MRVLLIATFLFLGVRLLPAQVTGGTVAVPPPAAQADPDEATIALIKNQALSMQWTMSYMQSIAQGALRDSLEGIAAPATGYGFGFEIGQYFDPVPLFVGGEAGVMFYPSKDRTIKASSRRSFTVETSNFILPVLGTIRFQPSIENWVYPYAELVGGFTVHSSDVTHRTIFDADTTTDSDGEGDFNWNYGVGVGVAVKVADVITLPHTLQRTLIDIRLRYITGTTAEVSYADLIDEASLDSEIRTSVVNRPVMIMFRLGVTFHL